MDNGYSLCVLCCCSFSTGSRTSASICRQDILNFFKLLVASPPQFTQDSGLSVSDLQLVLDSSGLSICNDCHAFITVALETRSRAEQMEINVRKLQRQILEQLRALHSEMDLFHQEMTKLEDVVKNSDESCLMFHMPRETQVDKHGRGNGILVLRERILDVVTDLRIYQVSCSSGANLPVNESDLEAMWEDAEQLVQCTPDISMDYYENDIVEDLNESSGGRDSAEPMQVRLDGILEGKDNAKLYMGHSVGARFYVESESDSEEIMIPNRNFKADVIRRAQVREESRTLEQNHSKDPLRRYYLKFDVLQNRLMVGDVEVIVSEEDETLKCSQCTIVGKRSKLQNKTGPKQNWRDMEKGILVHIIGKHLGGFTCVYCNEVFTSHTMIKKHTSKEHPGQVSAIMTTAPPDTGETSSFIPPPSPVVASPLSVEKPKPYACSVCSKAFRKPSELKRHFIGKHTKSQENGRVTSLIFVEAQTPSPPTPTPSPLPESKRSSASRRSRVQAPTTLTQPTISVVGAQNRVIPTKSAKRPHECHICLYAFTKGSHLKRHLEVHRKRNELV